MENYLSKNNQISISESSIDLKLSLSESYIYESSKRKLISSYTDSELVDAWAKAFNFIARDIGLKLSDMDKSYISSRIIHVLKTYYHYLSMRDIILAFELLSAWELDEYLPRDNQGNPERKHYQQFNVEYFSRIINSYIKKRSEVLDKITSSLPPQNLLISNNNQELISEMDIRFKRNLRNIFLRYKYKGILLFDNMSDDLLIYDFLLSNHLSNNIYLTKEDRNAAYYKTRVRIARGFINEFKGAYLKRDGITSKEVELDAIEIARIRAIKQAFDCIIMKELQIDNYLYKENGQNID